MSEPLAEPNRAADPSRTAQPSRVAKPDRAAQLRPIAVLIIALAVVGVVLGVVWAWWSPPVPAGINLAAGLERQENPDFLAADARFAVLTLGVGAVAGCGAWFLRPARGPWMMLALAVGGIVGAVLTGVVGNLIGGGTDDAPVNQVMAHLELRVQMTGSYYLEAALAVLVYSLLVAFAAADDLGWPDPARDAAQQQRRQLAASAAPQGGVEHARGDGDGPGLAHQHDLPAQEPH